MQIAPGALAFDTADTSWLGYHYGVAFGGYRVQPGGLAYTFGLNFEHWLAFLDRGQEHRLRPGLEFRIGGSGDRFFAYALFAPSAVLAHIVLPEGGSGTDAGLSLGFGAGIVGLLSKSFYLGTEFGGDVDFYFQSGEGANLYDLPLSWKVLLGFRFGG